MLRSALSTRFGLLDMLHDPDRAVLCSVFVDMALSYRRVRIMLYIQGMATYPVNADEV